MNLILHMVRKDLRHARLILCIWYPILTLAITLDANIERRLDDRDSVPGIPTPSGEQLELAVVVLIGLLVIFLDLLLRTTIVSRLVHDDSTVGSTAFWLSRPVSAGRLLASKAILLVAVMVLPPVVVQLVVTNQVFGSPSTVAETFLAPAVATAIFMMLAALTPSLARMAVLGGIMAGVGLGGVLALGWLGMPPEADLGLSDALTNELPWLAFFAVCVTVICHQYLTRRTKQSLVIAFSGIPVFLLVLSAGWFLESA